MAKNSKKTPRIKGKSLHLTVSNDHFEALSQMVEHTGIAMPQLAKVAFQTGLPHLQKRFAIDAETN